MNLKNLLQAGIKAASRKFADELMTSLAGDESE